MTGLGKVRRIACPSALPRPQPQPSSKHMQEASPSPTHIPKGMQTLIWKSKPQEPVLVHFLKHFLHFNCFRNNHNVEKKSLELGKTSKVFFFSLTKIPWTDDLKLERPCDSPYHSLSEKTWHLCLLGYGSRSLVISSYIFCL